LNASLDDGLILVRCNMRSKWLQFVGNLGHGLRRPIGGYAWESAHAICF
jgi:hypothetical protein